MPENPNPLPEKKVPWFLGRTVVIGGLVLVGPFALPLLWFSRAFKMHTKIIITVIAAALTYISWHYTPILLDRLSAQLSELQSAGQIG